MTRNESAVSSRLTELKAKVREMGDEGLIAHIPDRFLSVSRLENFILARDEERARAVAMKGRPYHLVLETTNVCNLSCPLCSTGIANAGEHPKTRDRGKMSFEHFRCIIDEVKGWALEVFLQNWGEPTLVAELPEMAAYAAGKGLWLSCSTNFSRSYPDGFLRKLIRSGLAHLHIDIDGTTQAVYETYRRGGVLDQVLKNVRTVVALKKQEGLAYPLIEASMLAMRHNEHQFAEFDRLCEGLGVDRYSIDRIQVNPVESQDWLPRNPEYVYNTYRGKRRTEVCHWPWSGMVINWDGSVSPCCIVDDPAADFGRVFDTGVVSLWNNDIYQAARSVFAGSPEKKSRTICAVCRNDTHNERLRRVGRSFSLRF